MSSVSLSVGDFLAVAAGASSRLGVKFEVYQVCGINEDGDTCWTKTFANRADAYELLNRTPQHEDVVISVLDVY